VSPTIRGEGLNMGRILSLPEADGERPELPATWPRCAVCRRAGGGASSNKLVSFGLEVHRLGQKGRGRHAGRIRLCERCWREATAAA
jgi:hypothetical protein